MEIKDAVAVVTGGASGLGLATTKRLLDAGAQVVVLDLRGEEAVRELGDRARFVQADVTDEAAVSKALDTAESMGPLRIVVNCAGTGNAVRVLSRDGVFPLGCVPQDRGHQPGRHLQCAAVGRRADRQDRTNRGGARRHRQHRVGGGVRRPDRPGRLLRVQGRGGGHDVADRTRPGQPPHPGGHHRARPVRHAIAGRSTREPARASLGKQVPHPSRLGNPDEYGALAVHIIENPMLNGEVIRLDGAIRMAPR